MVNERAFQRWVMGSARTMGDVEAVMAGTNIDQVDHEHHRLVQYAIDMNAALAELQQKGLSWNRIREVEEMLDRLYRYAAFHFESEIDLMYAHGIPGLDAMQQQHSYLLRRMQGYQADFRAGRSFSGADLKTDIMEWVVNHINGMDYQTFSTNRLQGILLEAASWEQIAPFVKNTNISRLDQEHRAIVEVLLELNRQSRAVTGTGLESVVRELLAVSAEHFAHEEALMSEYGIPGLAGHAAQHREFEQKIQLALAGQDQGDPAAVRRNLVVWLVDHINQVDMATFRHGTWLHRLMRTRNDPESLLVFLVRLDIPVIDQDHEHFIRSVCNLDHLLDQEMDEREKTRLLAREVRELRQFAQGHFGREEEIMRRSRHPLEHRHHLEHLDLLAGLDQYAGDLDAGNVRLGPAIREQLFTWWMGHTNGTDVETFRSWI